MHITLYKTNPCPRCTATIRRMGKAGYQPDAVVDITGDTALADWLKDDLGFASAPVVIVRDADGEIVEAWDHYSLDRIDALGARLALQAEPLAAAA